MIIFSWSYVAPSKNNILLLALDPQLLATEEPTKYLNQTVTHYLKVIHTSAGVLGFEQSFGDVDYYPNGGGKQPGCNSEICDHDRAIAYYAEAILSDRFLAKKCVNYESYSKGLCDNGERSYMGQIFPRTR